MKLQTALSAIFPSRCLNCGDVVGSDLGLCGTCWAEVPFINGLVCDECGLPLPGDSEEAEWCEACFKDPRPWTAGRAAIQYADLGRRLVLMLKNGDRPDIAVAAGKWMAAPAREILRENMLVAPVPLHWSRLLRRKFNQSALLARSLADELGLSMCPDLLKRTKATRRLGGLGAADRQSTVKSVIRIHPRRRHRIAGRPVLLVDDVLTSGATLGACTRACLAAGASEVCVVTMARVAMEH